VLGDKISWLSSPKCAKFFSDFADVSVGVDVERWGRGRGIWGWEWEWER